MQSYIPLNPAMFDTLIPGKSYTIRRTYTVDDHIKEQNEPNEFETLVEVYTTTLIQSLPNHTIPQLRFNRIDNNGNITIAGAWNEFEICSTD